MLLLFVFEEPLSKVRRKVNSGPAGAFSNSHRSIRELSFSPWPIFKVNKIQLNQDPTFQRKRTLNELQMFNKILSICTSIYWFKHCNVSRSTSFMKAFCRLITHQSVSYSLFWMTMMPLQMPFQSLENSHVYHSILAVFFLYGIVIRPFGMFLVQLLILLIIDFISSASLVLYIIIVTLIREERADLYIFVYHWACTLVCSHFCVCPFGSMPKVICDSWRLHFTIIIVVL